MGQRAGVSFELERLDVAGDELVVTGHWSGVRGLRFVRPTLVADGRRILATLEHKPWAPSLDRTWIAAFPWDSDEVDVDGLALAVGSQVTVALGDGRAGAEPAPDLAPPAPPPQAARAPEPEPVLAPAGPPPQPDLPRAAPPSAPPQADRALEDELHAVARERDAAVRERDAAVRDCDAAVRDCDAAVRDRERALAQLEEAVAAREAAVRTRARMELAHDEALQARERAEAALAAAHAQRDEANAQRDEVLLAYRGLQRHVQAERAQEERAGAGEPLAQDDAETPSGVRTMPAARTVMAELQRPRRPISNLPFSVFDLWVIRVLGTVAAACFILLLVSIMRVFI